MLMIEVGFLMDQGKLSQQTICMACNRPYSSHYAIGDGPERKVICYKDLDESTDFTINITEKEVYENIISLLRAAGSHHKNKTI